MNDDYVTLEEVELIHETELAWYVEYEEEQYWVPKSKCFFDEVNNELKIPVWMAENKGMV